MIAVLLCYVKQANQKRSPIVSFHWYRMSRRGKSIETDNGLVVAKGWGKEKWEFLLMGTGSFSGDEKVLKLVSGGRTPL